MLARIILYPFINKLLGLSAEIALYELRGATSSFLTTGACCHGQMDITRFIHEFLLKDRSTATSEGVGVVAKGWNCHDRTSADRSN
jgi:hypothetical protein